MKTSQMIIIENYIEKESLSVQIIRHWKRLALFKILKQTLIKLMELIINIETH